MKNILYILLAFLLFTGCKKEAKIERNLQTNGGKWDIVKYEEIVTSTWPASNKSKVLENHGLIQFNKDGSGWIITSDEYEAYIERFKYSNTNNELTFNYFEVDVADTYDLDWKKNSFTLTMEGTSTFNVYSPNPNGDSLTITTHRLYRYTCEKE